jgi:hypothetical protein
MHHGYIFDVFLPKIHEIDGRRENGFAFLDRVRCGRFDTKNDEVPQRRFFVLLFRRCARVVAPMIEKRSQSRFPAIILDTIFR